MEDVAIPWDVSKGKRSPFLMNIKGMSRDRNINKRNNVGPLGQHVAALSWDRNLRAHSIQKTCDSQCLENAVSGRGAAGEGRSYQMFHDDGMKSFNLHLFHS